MKTLTLLLALLIQGCLMYDNAIVDREVHKIREIQRISDLHAMDAMTGLSEIREIQRIAECPMTELSKTEIENKSYVMGELRKMEIEIEEILDSIKSRDIVK